MLGHTLLMVCRVPQKYLIQNNSGLSVYYWVDMVSHVPPLNIAAALDRLQCDPASALCELRATHPLQTCSLCSVKMRCQCMAVQGEAVQRTFHLDSGESETLKAVPTRKVLSVSTFSKGGSVEKVCNVINLYFEGNWMPIKVWLLSIAPL